MYRGYRGHAGGGRGTFESSHRGFEERSRGGPFRGASNRAHSTMPESVFHEQLVEQGLGSGSEGRPVEILSNFFKIITDGKVIYHYSIDLKKMAYSPDDPMSGSIEQYVLAPVQKGLEIFIKKASAEILNMYFKQNSEVFGRTPFVHDGTQKLYSTRLLDLQHVPQVQTFTIGGREIRFAVVLSLAAVIDLKELDNYYASGGNVKTLSPSIVPVYEQLFRFVIEKQFTAHQSSFYDLLQRERTSSRAFEFVRGFSISVRLTEFGLALNLHLKCSCLIERGISNVAQLVMALLNRRNLIPGSLSKDELKKVNKILSGLKVQTNHTRNPGLFTIDGLSHKTTERHQFKNFEGKLTNVKEYFMKMYNFEVGDLNLVRTMTPLGGKFGDKKEMIMLPMEVCHLVPDQFVVEYKLPALVQTEHLKLSTLLPNVYFPQVVAFVDTVAAIDPGLLSSFGVTLTTLPVKFPARVLPLPRILTGPRDFHIPASTPATWGVFCFDHKVEIEKLNRFIFLMMEAAGRKNMRFAHPSPVFTVKIEMPETVEYCLENLKNIKQAEFVLVVLPSENATIDKSTIYNFVKFGENNDKNIISQCVMGEKVVNTPQGYYDNLLDKINAKLGGTNMLVGHDYIQDLPFSLSETMVVGADVNHPGMIEKVPLSIAAVVGSFDANISHYSNDIRIQKKDRTETIHDIAQMLEKLLIHYQKKNEGRYPNNVIVFRDGVGDGHVKILRDSELVSMEAMLNRLAPNVKIAFIIVQKRHIGTSKPSKYTILRDDFGLKTDQIERLCFFACHNCARTRKTISIPTSIRYADLCAYRAKQLTDAYQTRNSDQTSTSLTSMTVDTELHEQELLMKLSKVLTIDAEKSEKLYYI
ncbi:hypothetical protein TYRP_014803 [Tyrophagus putrescentiae]|nr:hypothetical protein TYRP_014803 [Tyrophagus putrescentiae]